MMFNPENKVTPFLCDGARVARATRAMLTMTRLDVAALQRAYDGA